MYSQPSIICQPCPILCAWQLITASSIYDKSAASPAWIVSPTSDFDIKLQASLWSEGGKLYSGPARSNPITLLLKFFIESLLLVNNFS